MKALFRIVVDELPPIRTNHDVDILLREMLVNFIYVHMNICLDIWPYCSTDPANTSHHLHSNGTVEYFAVKLPWYLTMVPVFTPVF